MTTQVLKNLKDSLPLVACTKAAILCQAKIEIIFGKKKRKNNIDFPPIYSTQSWEERHHSHGPIK
jgi:hypothetical protein